MLSEFTEYCEFCIGMTDRNFVVHVIKNPFRENKVV